MADDLDGREQSLPIPAQRASDPLGVRSDPCPGFVAPVTIAPGGSGSWLRHLRQGGRDLSTILAVGTVDDVAALIARTRGRPALGWRVVGACTSTGAGPEGSPEISGVPVVGDLDTVAALALAGRYDAVAVSPAPGWTAVRLQQLAHDLDHSRTALLAAPSLVRHGGPRVRVTGVNGLPLLRLDHPTLSGPRMAAKGVLDRLVALLLLLLVSPIMLGCALAVRRDGGPVLRRSRCLGRAGREFSLLSFRSTSAATGAATRVGCVLRRCYLDDLPQLLNVVGGSMALVGPRPVELGSADEVAQRRLLVKPGLTGLWYPDRMPDVRYVERWTPALDTRILVKSFGAVLRRGVSH